MSEKLSWIADDLNALASQGLLRQRRACKDHSASRRELNCPALLDFASNDYLNLAADQRLVDAATQALQQVGVGARASAVVSGRTVWHERLEQRLAQFEGQPDAILFPTGMAANVGTVSALCSPDDLIVCDRLNHASLVDGCRLSKAQLRVYRHDDLPTLERELNKGSAARRRWIVTDSIFSMDGDVAPLSELCGIAERYDAELIVDEAHATGVFGTHGRGAAELLDVEDRIAVRIGTLSKAIGTLGGFVTGSSALIEWLWNRARTLIYSTALPPAVCAAAIAAIDIVESEPWRRDRLITASNALRRMLRELGVHPGPCSMGPIVPVLLGEPMAAVDVAARLFEQGFLVAAIRPPTVPRGTSRLRIVVTVAHTDEDLQRLANAVAEQVRAIGGQAQQIDPA